MSFELIPAKRDASLNPGMVVERATQNSKLKTQN